MIIKRIDFDPEFTPINIPVVIEREFFDALDKAPAIIERARKEASRIRKNIKEVLAQTVVEKEEERKRGFQEGREEGLAQVTEKLMEMEIQREEMMSAAEPQMVRMVMDIAEKVLGREVAAGAILDVVKQALSQSVGQKLVIRIHPTDVDTIKANQPEMLVALGPLRSVSMREDETVSAGGCIVESELGTVDARLETQLSAIRKALGL